MEREDRAIAVRALFASGGFLPARKVALAVTGSSANADD
jgi:hypothetical protein